MVVTKTYPVQIIHTRPVIKQHRRKSNKRFYALVILIFIATVFTMSYCMLNNVGPMNEMACFYKGSHNPTYKEMVDFINSDTTESNAYTTDYKCYNFSMDVINNAKRKGLEAGYVTIIGKPENHAIVVFRTTDKGMYYLEPQADLIFTQLQMDFMLSQQQYKLNDGKGGGINIEMSSYSINWFSGLL